MADQAARDNSLAVRLTLYDQANDRLRGQDEKRPGDCFLSGAVITQITITQYLLFDGRFQ